MSKKNIEYKSLLSTLANGATGDSRRLLQQYGKEDAKNTDDLQLKLAKLYAEQPDKVQIETDFARIHPHSKFILKYLSASQTPAGSAIANKDEKTAKEVAENKIISEHSSAEGMKEIVDNVCNCPRCRCMYLTQNPRNNAESNFDGTGGVKQQPIHHVDYVGVIGVIAITGLIIYAIHKNKI